MAKICQNWRKIADFGVFVMDITGLLDKTSTAI